MSLVTSLALVAALGSGLLPPDNPPFVSPSINLAWDDCFNGGAGGTTNKSFACDVSTGEPFRLIASVRPPAGITDFVGTLCVFDLQSASPTLPLWWQYQSGGCRLATSLTAVPVTGVTSCPDLELNPQSGGIDYAAIQSGPNRSRLRTAFAIDVSLAHPLDHTLEYTILPITIDRRRTTGLGSCSGCATPMCIVFESVLLDQVQAGSAARLTTLGNWYYATWQGPHQAVPCPAATPAVTRTWGQLKSLYR